MKVTRSDGVAQNLIGCVTNEDGEIAFSGTDFPDISITIELCQPAFLKRTYIRTVLNEELNTPLSLELVFGDANADGVINQADLDLISSYIGVTDADSDAWSQLVPGATVGGQLRVSVGDLDENQDGQITSADLSVATQNFGMIAN